MKEGGIMVKKTTFVATLTLAIMIAITAMAETVYVYVNTEKDGLRFHMQPNKKSSVEYTLEKGEKVELMSIKDGWAECNVWCDVLYCSVDFISEVPPDDESLGEYKVVAKGPVIVRNRPSKDGDLVRKIKPKKTIEVIGWLNGYAKVEGGFINGDYLEEVVE